MDIVRHNPVEKIGSALRANLVQFQRELLIVQCIVRPRPVSMTVMGLSPWSKPSKNRSFISNKLTLTSPPSVMAPEPWWSATFLLAVPTWLLTFQPAERQLNQLTNQVNSARPANDQPRFIAGSS